MFKVNSLSKKIDQKIILKNIDFEVETGQIGIFLGGSGVGKSTLLRILNNLEKFDTGSFTLNNRSLDMFQVNKNHTMGMVFQQYNLFENLSVKANITLALTKVKRISESQAEEQALSLLERYGLSDKVDEKVTQLSGGQKQRLAIARTVALNPKIISLDEPTSALDPILTGQVAKYLTDLAKDGCIVLIATHDISLVSLLKAKLFLMSEGTIVESVVTEKYQETPKDYPMLSQFLNPSLIR